MPMTLSGILQSGMSSLKTFQNGLAITSSNIANASTPGYSRQRMNLSEEDPLSIIPGQVGMGVQITSISRQRSPFIDNAVRAEIGQQAKYQQVGQDLQNMEGVLGNPTNPTLNADLTNFYNAFQTLSTSPQDVISNRQNVIEAGTTLASDFQTANAQLATVQSGLDTQVNQSATDINSMLTSVASLNQQINNVSQHGSTPNDLMDQRDQLLDKLSGYMDLTLSTQTNGSINIAVNGQSLVNNFTASSVSVASVGSPAHPQIQAGGVSLATSGGQVAGFVQSYTNIDSMQNSLDSLASVVINQVNAIHAAPGAAFDLNGAQGVNFFTGSSASTMAMNPVVQSDPAKVVAGKTAAKGDNTAALAMVALQDQLVYPAGVPTGTLGSAISTLSLQLGSQANQANSMQTTHSNSLKNLTAEQASVSGVSTDEELTNMMQYQRAYQAASRVITTVDECMDMIINRMGKVGL